MSMFSKLIAGTMLASTVVAGAAFAQDKPTIVTVVKVTGENWFTRMNEGVDAFGKDNPNVSTSQVGPAKADAAQQTRIIEDLVAKNVSAIAIVPMDPSALEGVLRRASQRGIKVITHEGDSLVNTDVDIEAFDNKAFGARINEKLAECMGKSGKWTSFVGSLGSLTHNQWVDAGAENAKQYPDMELVAEKNESFNDANRAYEKAKEILRKYPDIKGFQGSSAIDVIGIGRAVEEAGLQDKTCVYGLGLPKDTGPYLESGAVDQIFFWDPKDAGYVMNKVSDLVLKGEEIKDGIDLGVPGYEKMTVIKGPGKGIIIQGQAWVDADKSNYKDFPF
ncbi:MULTISPECIES: autoinducer 2 ABC transporter substrate-binding protein [Brucella/Ochrobactrum group]|uniref:Periplasmic binding protein/LacI transcriptional regulator n=1 Tax=Brucella anthropi (strain ATCC 49188 / DSM 6882 / CCUG 24695 / JCM 21032 / LMG 3331 / NBRC 15819 / NCTC 12168 / Alc 37) TaxID=439375 RepID=A6X6B2_BRUA4|nr:MULTISPECIES: autoinducer 2 ABC transporter substrate-binding protein [Brucella/Ochrobactrum group]RNL46740.1 autoinducer 2 ABC transporter substrate-binding protein [Ochrobactrum sp. MH181795]ABS16766.1 periplasmic binding protein/LacI transcriptional regulator [Brucella anthropi ATCC 49188]AIK42478.1 periplasmic binding s and sugar binding domain of LacI family protein [Brucella anthropi]KAB2726011.1 autoinducer 2 ABC transporter substrate-binding protein [Brucella anthropi]KAB2732622.1 a